MRLRLSNRPQLGILSSNLFSLLFPLRSYVKTSCLRSVLFAVILWLGAEFCSAFKLRKLTQDHRGFFPCSTLHSCKNLLNGPVVCHEHKCKCLKGYMFAAHTFDCVKGAYLGAMCNNSEQCEASDPHSYCLMSATLDPRPLHCQCSRGFTPQLVGLGSKACRPVNESGFLGGVQPFDSRDTIPIIMGCLAACLALLACCAGLVQLMRRKQSLHLQNLEQELRTSDEDTSPQELFIFSHHEQNHGHHRPGFHESGVCETILEEPPVDPLLDLPPSYKDVIVPPTYEEAMSTTSMRRIA